MQAGDIIHGATAEAPGRAYLVIKPLGTPGLFGQAWLCRRADDDAEVVVKTLRAGRSAGDHERFWQEARTLECVAAAEERAGKHYAVRLLDHSAADAPEIFLVLERAVGQNVLEDLVEAVLDWQHAPLDERLALEIAWQLAQALRIVHQAGICYDDMKLDNLFWSAERPDDPLRIIDWNVTSSVAERGGVAGDWARFGARLYELRTGARIGIHHDGTMLGAGPGGPVWASLPEGLRDLIEQALSLRYADDDALLRDLEREREQLGLGWAELLDRATIADGASQTIEVLAPLSRAERQLRALPLDDPQRDPALAAAAELRQRAAARRGVASARAIDNALQALARNEPRLAAERFQKAYAESGGRDPRPRRWLWLAQLAAEAPKQYRALKQNLEAGVAALSGDNLPAAREHLARASQAAPDIPTLSWLIYETDALLAATGDRPADGLAGLERLGDALEQYPDLKATRDNLRRTQAVRQRQLAALAHEQEVWAAATREAEAAAQAEAHGQDERALRHAEHALAGLEQLLTDGCTPEVEQAARASRETLTTHLDQLSWRIRARHIPEWARSADPRQRQAALTLAEQIIPSWGDLPELRKQMRQIDACFTILDRARADERVGALEQALAALDVLDRLGVKINPAGVELRAIRQEFAGRRAELLSGQIRARIQSARALVDEARQQLSAAACESAAQLLREIEAQALTPQAREELDAALAQAGDLSRALARVAERRDEVARAVAARDLGGACRLAQQLALDFAQLPRLAEEAVAIEQELWAQLSGQARELAAEYDRLSLRHGAAAHLSDLEARGARLVAQRRAVSRLGEPAHPERAALSAQADHQLAELEQSQARWQERRSIGLAELIGYIKQAETAASQGDSVAALAILKSIDEGYLPPDPHAHGLEPLLIRKERLAHELSRQREALLARARDLQARLDDPAAPLAYDELVEPFAEHAAPLDPEIQPIWQAIQERAWRLRQEHDRVERGELAAIGAQGERLQSAVAAQGERLDAALAAQAQRLADVLAALERAAERLEARNDQRAAELRDEIRRRDDAASQRLNLIEQKSQQNAELIQTNHQVFIRALLALLLVLLVCTAVIVLV